MPILYLLDNDGGFTAGDTDTGLTAYAYPSSTSATRARKAPASVALAMTRDKNMVAATLRNPDTLIGRRAIEQDAERIAVLRKLGTVAAAPDSAPPSLADPAPCEATEQGLQYVIPGAERRLPPTRAGKARKQDARQDNLF